MSTIPKKPAAKVKPVEVEAVKQTAPVAPKAAPAAEKAPIEAPRKATRAKAPAPVDVEPADDTSGPLNNVAGAITINGVDLSFGDTSKGGTAKSVVSAVLPRNTIQVMHGFNPRRKLDGLEQLANSIKTNGLLTALTVRPGPRKGVFYVVSGERRLRALDLLNRQDVPVLIRTDLTEDYDAAKAAAIAENSEDGRSNLNAVELGAAFAELQEKGWDVPKIARETGTHAMAVRRALELAKAPDDIRKRVMDGKLAITSALELSKMSDEVRDRIKDDIKPDSSTADIRRAAKTAAKELSGEVVTPTHNNRKTGTERVSSLVVWRSSREKQTELSEVAYTIANLSSEDLQTAQYYELRGAFAALLWARGDLNTIYLPDVDTTDSDERKLLKLFDGFIKAEAAKRKAPVEAETDSENEQAE